MQCQHKRHCCRREEGSHRHLKELEEAYTPKERKLKIVRSLHKSNHTYISFFVCRNPIEKLQSVYDFLFFQTQIKKKSFNNFPRFSPPSWSQYISKLSDPQFKDGLSDSVTSKCRPCSYDFDAVIKMETFDIDSR